MAFSRFMAAAFAALLTFGAAGSGKAALPDDTYSVTGIFDEPLAVLSGSFEVVGGVIQNFLITTDTPTIEIGDPSIYAGGGANEAAGTMFSASLSLTNPNTDIVIGGAPFLSFGTDGRFSCGGADTLFGADACQIRTAVFGASLSEKNGSYQIASLSAEVPLPASLVLMLGALGGLGLLRRRAKGA